jgi:hypothetical protein
VPCIITPYTYSTFVYIKIVQIIGHASQKFSLRTAQIRARPSSRQPAREATARNSLPLRLCPSPKTLPPSAVAPAAAGLALVRVPPPTRPPRDLDLSGGQPRDRRPARRAPPPPRAERRARAPTRRRLRCRGYCKRTIQGMNDSGGSCCTLLFSQSCSFLRHSDRGLLAVAPTPRRHSNPHS